MNKKCEVDWKKLLKLNFKRNIEKFGESSDVLGVDAGKLLDNVNKTIKSLNYQLMQTVSDENNIHVDLTTHPFVNTIECVEGALIYCKIECFH